MCLDCLVIWLRRAKINCPLQKLFRSKRYSPLDFHLFWWVNIGKSKEKNKITAHKRQRGKRDQYKVQVVWRLWPEMIRSVCLSMPWICTIILFFADRLLFFLPCSLAEPFELSRKDAKILFMWREHSQMYTASNCKRTGNLGWSQSVDIWWHLCGLTLDSRETQNLP